MENRWRKQYRRKLKRLKEKEFNEESKEIVLDFLKFKESQNLSYHRLTRIIDFLYHLLENFDFNFSETNQDKVERIMIWLKEKEWSEWTKYSYARIFKNFLRWLKEKFNLEVRLENINFKKPKNSLMPEYLLNEEEFNKLMNATDDLQTKLLLGLLYESACRIGEILSLKIQNVSFNQYGARLIVKGKTGQRVIPIVWFANLLRQFIESHPFKEDPEAPLFYYKNRNGELVPLKYDIFRVRLKRLCEKVGIKKRIHFHLFRHSRLTELAKNLPEQILKQIAGWTPDSKMAKVYLHLSQRDVEESLLAKVYGIKVSEENEGEKIKVCPKCGEVNPYFATICQRCTTPLDEKKLIELNLTEEQIKEINEWAEVFHAFFRVIEKKHPDIWKEMYEILRAKGKEHLISKEN